MINLLLVIGLLKSKRICGKQVCVCVCVFYPLLASKRKRDDFLLPMITLKAINDIKAGFFFFFGFLWTKSPKKGLFFKNIIWPHKLITLSERNATWVS